MTSKEITTEVSPTVNEAKLLSITSTEQLTNASTLRERIKTVQKQVEEDKELLYRPAKNTLDEITKRYDVFLKPLKEALAVINDKMSTYQTAIIAKQKEEEAKIANRIGEGKGKLKVETAMNKMANIEKAPVLDMTGFVNKPKLEIVKAEDIPDEYWILDFDAIETALKEDKVVSGAKLVDNFIPRSK